MKNNKTFQRYLVRIDLLSGVTLRERKIVKQTKLNK